jgi:hypothetical protein
MLLGERHDACGQDRDKNMASHIFGGEQLNSYWIGERYRGLFDVGSFGRKSLSCKIFLRVGVRISAALLGSVRPPEAGADIGRDERKFEGLRIQDFGTFLSSKVLSVGVEERGAVHENTFPG